VCRGTKNSDGIAVSQSSTPTGRSEWMTVSYSCLLPNEKCAARPVVTCRYARIVTPEELANLAHLRRARDLIDREYAPA
jgi:hypothetical protein